MRACPFCGSGETRVIPVDDSWTEAKNIRVVCNTCDAMGTPADNPEQAKRFWDGVLAKSDDAFKRYIGESWEDDDPKTAYLRAKWEKQMDNPDNDYIPFQEWLDEYGEFYSRKFNEEGMGGVSAPMSTLNNTPGVGNATPATADGNSIGSGDRWDSSIGKIHTQATNESNLNPYDKIGMMMAKKMGVEPPFKQKDSRTNTIVQNQWEELDEDQEKDPESIDDYVRDPDKVFRNAKKRKVANETRYELETLDNYIKASKHVPDHPLTLVKKKMIKEEMGAKTRDIIKNLSKIVLTLIEQGYDDWDDISGEMYRRLKPHQFTFFEKYSREIENEVDKILDPGVFESVNEEDLRTQEATKDENAKYALENLGIAYEFKDAKSGKKRVFIKDKMKDVLDKLKAGGWEEFGRNPEDTIRKYSKGDNILTIYAEGKQLPRATLTLKNQEETSEKLIIRKVVPGSINPYLKS
jgi:hypothetical protein